MQKTQPTTTEKANGRKREIGALWKKNTPLFAICNWSDIQPEIIRGCTDAVTRAGGAIMLGLTSDGGAFSICVLHGEDKIKEYPHGRAECEDLMRELTEYFAEKIEL